jgi:hypothetical protein
MSLPAIVFKGLLRTLAGQFIDKKQSPADCVGDDFGTQINTMAKRFFSITLIEEDLPADIAAIGVLAEGATTPPPHVAVPPPFRQAPACGGLAGTLLYYYQSPAKSSEKTIFRRLFSESILSKLSSLSPAAGLECLTKCLIWYNIISRGIYAVL